MALANHPRVSRSLSYSTPDGSGVLKGRGQFTLGGGTLCISAEYPGGAVCTSADCPGATLCTEGGGHFTLLHRQSGIKTTLLQQGKGLFIRNLQQREKSAYISKKIWATYVKFSRARSRNIIVIALLKLLLPRKRGARSTRGTRGKIHPQN